MSKNSCQVKNVGEKNPFFMDAICTNVISHAEFQ